MYRTNSSTRLRHGVRRARRIARGFIDPRSRPRYVEALGSRLRGQRPDPDGAYCLVCGAAGLEHRTVQHATKAHVKPRELEICPRCGHISLPHNRNDYQARGHDQLPTGDRCGSEDRPGRDFFIAKLALPAIDRDDVDVLMYGVGASRDNHTIASLPQVRSVAIGDIMKLRDDGQFVDLTEPPPRRFPLVIASEVVEHFRNPRADFSHLFDFVARSGLLVCGTNVYAGGDLSKDPYIFFSDHTSYYTAPALATIASANGYHIDFRMPVIGGGLRKRYVMFTRSRAVLDRLAVYFGAHTHAPSETRFGLRRHDPSAGSAGEKS